PRAAEQHSLHLGGGADPVKHRRLPHDQRSLGALCRQIRWRSSSSMWCRNPDCEVDDEKICSSAVVTTAARSKMKPEEVEVAMVDLSDHRGDGISPLCESQAMPVKLAGVIGFAPTGFEGFQDLSCELPPHEMQNGALNRASFCLGGAGVLGRHGASRNSPAVYRWLLRAAAL